VRAWLEAWELQCCGEPFALGDEAETPDTQRATQKPGRLSLPCKAVRPEGTPGLTD
jgi:hypothetical protein